MAREEEKIEILEIEPQQKKPLSQKVKLTKTKKRLLILVMKIVFVFVFVFVSFGLIFGLKRMGFSYMNPNIKEGDLLFYYRLEREYKPGDVVVISKDNEEYVLRIVAVAGQTVDINEKNELLVDNYLETYNVYYPTKKNGKHLNYPYKVLEGEYFVVADYRPSKKDSRLFGTINIKNIKGKVISKLQVRNI